ncbi:MAG TPA: DoxX family protein [Verrucomicrobiae bacterium]|nr:DoxX family protein [Verrucomicrobiae bacterium]
METITAREPRQSESQTPKSATRYLPHIARVLEGLMFLIFGLNGFFNFIPTPKSPMPEGAVAFSGALIKTGYMFPLIMGTQLLVGVLLLVNRFVPLALVLIMPVLVNIISFHIFLQPAGIGPGAFLLVLNLYLAWKYRDAYRAILTARATPAGG